MITGYNLSAHLINERMDRLEHIANTIGFGDIKYKKYYSARNCIQAITDTGVLCILDEAGTTIITMYPLTITKAKAIFKEHIPDSLYKTLRKNLKNKYITE